MFLNFKEHSVLDHINTLLESDNPYGFTKTDVNDPYTTYSDNKYNINIRSGDMIEIDVRETGFKNVFSYCKNDEYESFNSDSISYFLNEENNVNYKEFRLNDITYTITHRDNFMRYKCSDNYACFSKEVKNNITVLNFRSTFVESTIPNIHILEKKSASNKTFDSSVSFRAPEFDKNRSINRTVMYELQIYKEDGITQCIIQAGFKTEVQFELDTDDCSMLNIFNPFLMFQNELGMDERELFYLNSVRGKLIGVLEFYKLNGGHLNIANTMLENIKAVQKL